MAVTTDNAFSGPLAGNDAAVDFPFTFTAQRAEEVIVEIEENDARTVVNPADYSVALGVNGGGTVTFNTAPTSAQTVWILHDLDLTRTSDYTNGAGFNAESFNAAFDRVVLQVQEVRRDLDHAVFVPAGDLDNPNYRFPLKAVRANKVMGFTATGDYTLYDNFVANDLVNQLNGLDLPDGGLGDVILFYDSSEGNISYLQIGSNLSIDGTTLNGAGSVAFANPTIRLFNTATDTPTSADANNIIHSTGAVDAQVTIEDEATQGWQVGNYLEIKQAGLGRVELVAGAGVTLESRGGILTSAGLNSVIVGRYEGGDVWAIGGDLEDLNIQPNQLLSGGQIVWESGLTFRVSAATYIINGLTYASSEATVTLDTADPTNGRIDLLILDTSGPNKITGTAAVAPSEPDIDPASQLKLSFVLVGALEASPSGIVEENIYLENTEWTTSVSGAGFNAASGADPYEGAVNIEGTAVSAGDYISFDQGAGITLETFDVLPMYIKNKAAWAGNQSLRVQLYANGVALGTAVTIRSGRYGFDTANTSAYQQVAIPLEDFAVPFGTTVDQLRITARGSGHGFYIDNVFLQGFGDSSGGNNNNEFLTQAEADTLYKPITGLQMLPINASAMTPRATSGAASGSTETTTNNIMVESMDFDAATDEFVQFGVPMPESWDEGTITAAFVWTSGATGDVVWGIQGVAIGDDDVLDAAFGAAQTVTDSVTLADDLMVSGQTAAATIGGTPAAGDLVIFQVYRDADAVGDTLAADARLLAVRLYLTTNAADDS